MTIGTTSISQPPKPDETPFNEWTMRLRDKVNAMGNALAVGIGAWNASTVTGTINTVAGFDGTGAPVNIAENGTGNVVLTSNAALLGAPTTPTAAVGTNTTQMASTAYAVAAAPNPSYRTILQAAGSITAGVVAGTYGIGLGDPVVVSGGTTVKPLATIYIAAADYPTVNSFTTKMRIRAQLYTNDVAPTGNFTFGLYPITRPGTSGGAGVCIYTIGTVVTGSNGATFTTPAADGLLNANGSDFAIPADGHYIIGLVTTATVAASAHVQMDVALQMRNT